MDMIYERKNISMIACIGKNRELGKDNKLIFHFKKDMQFFKTMTMDNAIFMGSKTFKSLPNILPEREHIILTHKNASEFPEGVIVVNNLEDAFDKFRFFDDHLKFVYVIGGASIYEQMLPYAQTIILTHIDAEAEADCYFPTFNENDYRIKTIFTGYEEGTKFEIVKYTRK